MNKKKFIGLCVVFMFIGAIAFMLFYPLHGLKAINPELYNDNPHLKTFAIEFKNINIRAGDTLNDYPSSANLDDIEDVRVIDILLEGFNEKCLKFNPNFFKETYKNITTSSYTLPPIMIDQAVNFRIAILDKLREKLTQLNLDSKHKNRCYELLIHALKTGKCENERSSAAGALGVLNDKRAVEPLIHALQTEKSNNVRGNVAWSLGDLKDKRAVEPLIQI